MMVPLFLTAVSVFAAPEDKDLVQHKENALIIGGVPAAIEEFPFTVALIYLVTYKNTSKVEQGCGGAIITENWVLTAAHCVDEDVLSERGMELINIRAASSFTDKWGILRGIMETVSHNYLLDDIALIKVDEPWPFNGVTISPARLPGQDDPIPVYSEATIMGWGKTEVEGTSSEILMKMEVVVISHIFCNASWWYWERTVIDEKKMCTLFTPVKKPSVTMQGDSGSPVVVNGEVVGVHIWGHRTNYVVIPNVQTRVSSFIDWIEENVGPLPRAK